MEVCTQVISRGQGITNTVPVLKDGGLEWRGGEGRSFFFLMKVGGGGGIWQEVGVNPVTIFWVFWCFCRKCRKYFCRK